MILIHKRHCVSVAVRRAERERVQEVRQEQPVPGVVQRRARALPPLRPPVHRRAPNDARIRVEIGTFLGPVARLRDRARRRSARRLDKARVHHAFQRATARRLQGLHDQFGLRHGANQAEARVLRSLGLGGEEDGVHTVAVGRRYDQGVHQCGQH